MAQTRGTQWGKHSLQLDLPIGAVRFSGISARQLGSLRQSYCRFIDTDARSSSPCLDCRVYRLPSPLQADLQQMTVDGVYTPLKNRGDSGITLSGYNFTASLSLGTSQGQATLGVASEDEFTRFSVIENFLRVFTAHRSLALGGVMLHSAGLLFDEFAYIFAGRSNTGKTTLTRKACERGATVLSDDINLLLPDPSGAGYHARAMPFTGEFGYDPAQDAFDAYNSTALVTSPGIPVAGIPVAGIPVATIILLEQGDELKVERVSPASAVARLLSGSPFVNTDEQESDALLNNLTELVERLPVMRLTNRRQDDINDIMTEVRRLTAL